MSGQVVKLCNAHTAVIGTSPKGPVKPRSSLPPRGQRLELSWVQIPITVSWHPCESWHLTLIVWPEHQEVSITRRLTVQCRVLGPLQPEPGFDSRVGKIPGGEQDGNSPCILAWELTHGQRKPGGYSPKQSDTTERPTHCILAAIPPPGQHALKSESPCSRGRPAPPCWFSLEAPQMSHMEQEGVLVPPTLESENWSYTVRFYLWRQNWDQRPGLLTLEPQAVGMWGDGWDEGRGFYLFSSFIHSYWSVYSMLSFWVFGYMKNRKWFFKNLLLVRI